MLGEEGLVAHDYFPIFFKLKIMTRKQKEIIAFIILYGGVIGGFILAILNA